MPAQLVLGPLLRHVGERDATVWVETDARTTVEVCGATAETFEAEGHHYALVHVDGLRPAERHPYTVSLDGEQAWPPPGYDFPAPEIRTLAEGGGPVCVAFGSCRVGAPHEPPFTLTKDDDERGRELDALIALARRVQDDPQRLPHLLLLLGDQVYADECSPGTRAFIRSRRDIAVPPGEEVADFEEYTHLYYDSWRAPVIRWLLSTVASAMIFDDHDVHDDWNISRSWVRDARGQSWWDERIVGGFMSYWIYQHLGNLSPEALAEDDLYARVCTADGDVGPLLREFSFCADREAAGTRWTYARDLGRTRVVVMDSRAGRVLEHGRRSMVDAEEWEWIEGRIHGDFDHLLLGTSLPAFLAPGMHHLEAFSEALCEGVWGRWAARRGEWLRRTLDLEHWAAFGASFRRLCGLLRSVAAGEHGPAPASVVVLSGDVHHAYVTPVRFADPGGLGPVYQAVCSPFRNPLNARERRVIRFGCSRAAARLGGALARAAGVPVPPADWRIDEGPWFDNQVSTIDIDGRAAVLRIEKAVGTHEAPELQCVLERRLSAA